MRLRISRGRMYGVSGRASGRDPDKVERDLSRAEMRLMHMWNRVACVFLGHEWIDPHDCCPDQPLPECWDCSKIKRSH